MTSRPSHVTVTRHRHTNTVLPCVICMQQQSRHQTSAVNMSGASHRTWQLQKHLHAQRCMTREAACYDPTCRTPHKTRSRAKQTFQCQAMHMTWQLHNHCLAQRCTAWQPATVRHAAPLANLPPVPGNALDLAATQTLSGTALHCMAACCLGSDSSTPCKPFSATQTRKTADKECKLR